MIRLEAERAVLSVVDDQHGSPTWARDLARGLLSVADAVPSAGIYHATNSGETTWHGLARAVFEDLGADPDRVQPTSGREFTRPVPRPGYSVLSPRAWNDAGLPRFSEWREALARTFRYEGAALRAGR